jgi:hypothetical protein
MKANVVRFSIVLVLVLSALGFSATTALAGKPVQISFDLTGKGEFEDLCPFKIETSGKTVGIETDFYDKNGNIVKSEGRVTEQDTYFANGKTLTSLEYHYNFQFLYDSAGNPIHMYVNGVAVKVPLPGGGLFIAAGRSDFAAHPGATFILVPDHGHATNIAGFCAALAP